MPSLTTVDGYQITFSAKAVAMLTDHDASTGQAVTCVYGITKGVLHIEEGVQEFLQRISMTKKFAQLTRPNDSPVWMNAGAVASVRAPLPNEYVDAVNAVVSIGSLFQGVTETPAEAVKLINAQGGSL
jgi:hypothetical protein